MTLEEIKAAVDKGLTVHWANTGYVVKKDNTNSYYIMCRYNSDLIGLTHLDGKTLNGKPNQFFIPKDELEDFITNQDAAGISIGELHAISSGNTGKSIWKTY
jgi:hypothetical protein